MIEEIIYEDRTYKLHADGFKSCHFSMTEEEKMKGLYSMDAEEIKLAESWIDALRQTGEYQLFSANEKLSYYTRTKIRGSYSLKHTAERWAGTYISNGAMIQAARNKGLAIIHKGGINCQIGIYFTKRQRDEYYLHQRNIPMTQGDIEKEKKEQEKRSRSLQRVNAFMRERGEIALNQNQVSTLFEGLK